MSLNSIKKPFWIAFTYIIFGILWIEYSDKYLFTIFDDLNEIWYYQRAKGFGYVLITGIMLYALIQRVFKDERQKKQELDTLLKNPNLGKVITNTEGIVVSTSSNFRSWFYKEKHFQNKHFNEFVKAKDHEINFIDILAENITAREITLEIEGIKAHCEVTIRFNDPYLVLYLTRVDEKVHAKEKLRLDLLEKNALINSTPDYIWSIDTDMRLVSFNDSYRQAIEPVLQRKLKANDPVIVEEFGEELAIKWKGYYNRALHGESFKVDEHTIIEGKDSYGEISFNPIRTEDEIIGVSCINRDITESRLAEVKLRDEARRLRESQEIGRLGDWEYNPVTKETFWSDQVFQIFERDPKGGVPSMSEFQMLFKVENTDELNEAMTNAVEKGESYDLVLQVELPSGKKSIRAIGRPVHDEHGVVTKLIGIVQDITEQVKAENERGFYLSRLKAVSDNLPGAIFQYKLNADGTDELLYLSKGSSRLWGVTPEKAMADNSEIWSKINESDLPNVLKSISESAQNMSQWTCEWRSKLSDEEERWHRGIGIPRRNGNAIIWDSIIMDITDKKNFELALEEREITLSRIYENAFDGILACDMNGKITFFNRRLKEWVGSPDNQIATNEFPKHYGLYTLDKSRLLKPDEMSLSQALKGNNVKNYRFCIINNQSPKGRYVEANSSALQDKDSTTRGAMVIIRDITEQYQNDLELNEAILSAIEEERQSIASQLHDGVVQSLSVASMNMNNLLLDKKVNDELMGNKVAQTIEDAIEGSRNIAHELMPITVRDFGLVGAVEELVYYYKGLNSIKIDLYFNESKRLSGDLETQIFRVVQEALKNVYKHADAKTCHIDILFQKYQLIVSIRDDGRGIDSSQINNGIGLRTMKYRVTKYNGKLKIDSSENGTSIIVKCPLQEEQSI